MEHLIPVDIADQCDAHAREVLEAMVAADALDIARMNALGIVHSVSSLAVAFLDEVRRADDEGGTPEREYATLKMALALAHAIRSQSVPNDQ